MVLDPRPALPRTGSNGAIMDARPLPHPPAATGSQAQAGGPPASGSQSEPGDSPAAGSSPDARLPGPATGLRFALPKGRMQIGVARLLQDAGISVRADERGYRPQLGLAGASAKLLKPRNIVAMLAAGTRDVGFCGLDLVEELGASDDLVELLDTGLDPVAVVAAAPREFTESGLPPNPVIATEYVALATRWMRRERIDGTVLQTWGATEVFPPEDADLIVDNCATGSTLRANGLVILDELLRSSTRLYASRSALERPATRQAAEDLALLLRAVLAARTRVIVECNVPADALQTVVDALPAMREPTVSPLNRGVGYAVKAAVPRADLARIVPLLKARGASDILISSPEGIIP